MEREPLNAEVPRQLALIEKGHQLEGQQPSEAALNRARRILEGSLSPGDAENELDEALRRIRHKEGS
jgi:hypothetical protein